MNNLVVIDFIRNKNKTPSLCRPAQQILTPLFNFGARSKLHKNNQIEQ